MTNDRLATHLKSDSALSQDDKALPARPHHAGAASASEAAQAAADPLLAMQASLHALRRFRSPAVGALLALAILLGKALVCQHAPQRAVFFDAMLMVPISMFAYHEGLITGLIAALVASAVDLVVTSKAAGLLIPAYLALAPARTGLIMRLFSLELVAGIVATLSAGARHATWDAEKKTEQYLKRIYLLERHTQAIESDARSKQAEFEKSLLRYSSLVYLLEESVQKIYSNLEIKHLFQSLFRVLEECFGSTCASVYLKDARSGSYFLASAFGADRDGGREIPMMLRTGEFYVAELERTRGATCWDTEHHMTEFARLGQPAPAVISGTLLDKGRVVGLINIHAVDRDARPDAMLMGMVCNIASIALANARLFGEVQWMAERDPLTKLYNRRTFHAELESQIAAHAMDSAPFALIMLDIDHFKSFNDTYGHQAGDAVLEWFARHCEESVGEPNCVYRYGGEEFTIIMPDADGAAAAQLAERVRRRIAESAFNYGGVELKVTLSCGVAAFPKNASDADELVRKADRALYRAKGAGRNTVALSDSGCGHDSAIVPYEVRVAAGAHPAPAGAHPAAAPRSEHARAPGPAGPGAKHHSPVL